MVGDLIQGRRLHAVPSRPGLRDSPTARCDDRQGGACRAPGPAPGSSGRPPRLPTRQAPDGLIRYVRYRPLKRILDLLLLIPASLVAVPLIAVGALAVRLVSAGSPFYGQERVGFEGRPFILWKLRTMHPGAEHRLRSYLASHDAARREWESHFKLTHDPRVLPVLGPILRHTSLDELPQLLNVLRGDMSIVGPRPALPSEVAAYPPAALGRLDTKPGLTGVWQVAGRAEIGFDKMVEMDLAYVKSKSVFLDLAIMLLTARAVMMGRGAY